MDLARNKIAIENRDTVSTF